MNAGDLTDDVFNLPIYVPFQDVALLANNQSFQNINIIAGTMASGQTLSLVPIGTVSTANLVYIFEGDFTVGTGATLTVGTGTSVLIDPVTITDNGVMNVTGASIGFVAGYSATTQILVNGTLAATGSSFYTSGGNYASFTLLQVDSGGELTASTTTFSINELSLVSGSILNAGDLTGDTFSLPIYVPFQDVALLANNQSFQNINIIAGTMASGQTLSLVPIGTVSTASLVYVFEGNFTVGTGATLTVGTGTSVLIDPVTITDNGVMNVTGASIGFVAGYSATTQILVNGTLAAAGSSFYTSGGNYASFTLLQVDSGGELTASTTTFSVNQLSLVSDSILNAGDLTNDVFNLPIYVPFQDVALLANNQSFQNINIIAGTMASGQTLSLVPIGTVSTANLVYVFEGNFTIGTGATLTVGTGTSVLIDPVTITDNGVMNVTGASIGFVAGYSATTQILVNGTLAAAGSSFYTSGGNYASFTLLQVDSGGELTASNTTFSINQLSLVSGSIMNTGDLTDDVFNLPIYVPFQDVALLANNQSFQNINIIAGTMASGQTLSLVPIGTVSTASLVYVFEGNFTVGTGATLTVGAGTSVLIDPVTITDNGVMNVTGASIGFVAGYSATTQILVNGTLSATGSNFYISGGNYASFAQLQVNSGGKLTAGSSTFALNQLALEGGSTDNLEFVIFANLLAVNSGASIDIHNDDFSSSSATVVASGTSTATIDLTSNFWGTLNTSQIAAKITDHTENSSLPTVLYEPVIAENATGVTAANATATFSIAAQSVALSATVISAAGLVNTGTVTFTILNGSAVVGTTVVSNVANGLASAEYALPASTAGGTYTIQAVFSGTSSLLGSSDSGHTLTIGNVSTNTAAASAATTFSAGNQSVALSATVTSSVGIVNEGQETFTILSGNTVIATPVSVNVNAGAANASYALPGGTTAATYTIQAVYDGTSDYAGSMDSSQSLIVSAATTATAEQGASATFGDSSVMLSATITSPAGVVNEGTETFTILNGMTPVGSAVTVNVSMGSASASYALPDGTPPATYVIQAVYNRTVNFVGSTDASQTLVISAAPTVTAASGATAVFGDASVGLSATVTSSAGVVDVGTETFTIFNGMTPVGSPVTVNVSSGAASAAYPLPAGTMAGTYIIQAVFSGTTDFVGDTDRSQSLLISAAGTTTAATSVTAAYGAASVALNATVVSPAGVVDEGTETFSILNGMTLIGSSVTVDVSDGAASASYGLPAGTAAGSYTILAAFNATTDFGGSTDSSHTLSIVAYPDLRVQGLAVSPTAIMSGDTVDVTWNDANTGDGAVGSVFVDHLTVVNTTTSATVLDTNVTYDPSLTGNAPIGPGGSVARSYTFALPQGFAGTGDLSFTVTTDAGNQITEYNTSGTGETNNSATLSATSILASYSVSSNADSGAGSLRDAIDYVNTHGGNTTIALDFGTGSRTIDLMSPLPAITAPLTIDGTTQAGYSGTPLIELNGAGAGVGANGLTLAGNGITVKGLIIVGFSGDGIEVTGNNELVESNYIGIDSTGNHALGNGGAGIAIIDGATGNTIGGTAAGSGNVISGNAGDGIDDIDANANLIAGNWIGTDAVGTAALANSGDGVFIDPSSSVTIGGTALGAGNLISGNAGNGIEINDASGTLVQGNLIGLDQTGTRALGNHGAGVLIDNGSTSNTIGAAGTGGGRNFISGNAEGILITGATTAFTDVAGNLIGTNVKGTAAVANLTGGVIITGGIGATIGAPDGPAGNVISGNTGDGIDIGPGVVNTLVEGNYIGTDQTGIKRLPNTGSGVSVNDAVGVTIGGTAQGVGNVISANAQHGSVDRRNGHHGRHAPGQPHRHRRERSRTPRERNFRSGRERDIRGHDRWDRQRRREHHLGQSHRGHRALCRRDRRTGRGQPDRHRYHRLGAARQRQRHPDRRRFIR